MSILKQNLPLSLMPLDYNPEGTRYQVILEGLTNDKVLLRVDDSLRNMLQENLPVRIEFVMGKFQFRFDTHVVSYPDSKFIAIQKPREIRKSTIRASRRLPLHTDMTFNIWTQPGFHNAKLTDISSVGIRMLTKMPLAKNTLIGVTIQIPGKALRVICQGIVRWCRVEEELAGHYSCGVMFTTLSNDAAQRLEKYIDAELALRGE
ncbi:MAG: PilZ domain-containing protein [Turneriella sp.]|nr:PilZ domain-containing protein [Turneriella sp.]